MKKRIMAILIAAIMAAALTSCSGKTEKTSETGAGVELNTEESLPKATDSPMVTMDPAKVMSLDTDKGLLTVRYFLLEAKTKSGDSILIHTPAGKFIMIDTGVPESGDQLVNSLKTLGVDKIEMIINTHPHVDHIGGVPAVVKAFPVGAFYKNFREYDSIEYKNAMAALNTAKIPIKTVAEGDTIDIGNGLQFTVYNPPKNMDPFRYAQNGTFTSGMLTYQLNQEALALMLTYKDVKLLFCGDIYQTTEAEMIARYPEGTFDADIVHAPHHGAATSSSIAYVQGTSPTIAVMSTNGLQSLPVYGKYDAFGAVVLANSLNGNLLITTDGTKESIHGYVEHQIKPEDGKTAPTD